MTTYQAFVTREDHWWMVSIPELDGLTQARRLSEVGQMAREWIATHLEIPFEDVQVHVTIEMIEDVDVMRVVEEIARQREDAEEMERLAVKRSAQLAKTLAAHNIPVRDIGTALGVSFQRAHQLIQAA